MKNITLVLLLFFFSISVSAQKIYFCKGYSDTGEPKGVSDNWTFDNKATEVYFLYNNGKTTFDFASVFFLVENKSNGTSDKVEFKVAQNRNWDAMKYTFKEAGQYIVSALGNENKLLAIAEIKVGEIKTKEVVKEEIKKTETEVKDVKKEKEVVQVEVKKEEPKEIIAEKKAGQVDIKEVKDVLYYDELKVTFCEQMKGGEIINPKNDFKMSELGAYVEVVLQNTKPMNTDIINVDIWKKDDGGTYNEYAGDKQIKLNKKNKQVNFHYSFFKPGEYKISFFNNDNVWMTTGYVSISR